MPSHVIHDLWTAATDADARHAAEFELSLLRDVLKMLPAGVTVQDQHGDFLLINDAAASQLGIGGNSRASARSPQLSQRGESGLASLRSGRPAILEECINEGQDRQVLLTAHRPVSIANHNLLLSSSADISEQKAFEDQLFRSAYYGHGVGDTLLVEVSKRLARDLRCSDMLARISGDEFLLLLSPIQGAHEVEEFLQSTLSRLSAPFFIDGSEIFASTSIGVSLYPDHGTSYNVLCQNADLAMYRVKNDGKGAVAFFD